MQCSGKCGQQTDFSRSVCTVTAVMYALSETWPAKTKRDSVLHPTEMTQIRLMCGVNLKDKPTLYVQRCKVKNR